MADISRLSRLLNGVQRQVDLGSNTLVVDNLKIKMGSGSDANHATFSGTLTAARTITMPDADVNLGDIALNSASRHDALTLNAGDSTQQSASLSGQELTINQATTSTDGVMSAEDKSKLDGIEAGATADQSAAEVPYNNATSGLTAADVQAAIDEVEGRLDTAESGISQNTTSIGENSQELDAMQVAWNQLINLSGVPLVTDPQQGVGVSRNLSVFPHLGTFTGNTISDYASIKAAFQELETAHEANAALLAGWEWQESVIDYIADNTVAPPTEVSGDRYMLSHDGGAPNAAWDGASAGDLVEFDGTSWVAVSPTTGMIASVDDETTSLRQWSGSAWVQKFFESTTASTGLTRVGFDIRLADAATNASGIQVASGAITLENLSAFSTTDLSEGTNLYFTEARVLASVLSGIDVATNGSVSAADSVLSAIGKLAANQADLVSLSGVAQGAVDLGTFTGTTIADSSSIKSALQALETAVEAIDASDDLVHTQADTNDWTVADGSTVAAHLDELGDRVASLEDGASALTASLDAGETLAAGVKAVRYGRAADAGFVAGRVYLADKDASSVDNFYAVGLVVATGEVAGTAVTVYKQGEMTAASHGFTVGEPIFLDASGALSNTSPSAADEAIVRVGIAKDANTIDVSIQVMGVA